MPTAEQKQQEKRIAAELGERIMDLMSASLGLVAALAWNDAFQSLFKYFFGEAGSLYIKFLYAVLITAIVLLMTRSVARLFGRFKSDSSS